MADHRWAFPGLHYFEDNEIDRALFFGREKEIKQLAERMIAEDLTVLFGKSGDGKTSLINAGLKWAFREMGYLPVRARPFNIPVSKTPLAELYEAIELEAGRNGLALPAGWQRETLWESFLALRPTEENGLKPIVLVLDQFEELFTLMAGRWQEQEDFITQLADLVRGRIPEAVREKYRAQLAQLAAASDDARQLEQLLYGSAAPTVRILLSLREDYLAFLNNLGRRIPKVFASRYRLSSLSIEQARAAIANPPQQKEVLGQQAFRIEDDATEALLKFLTVHSSRSGVSEEVVGPPQLQVLCRQLEEQMRQRDKNSISVADLGGDEGMRKLLSRYYRVILEKFPVLRFGPGPRRATGLLSLLRRLLPLHSPRFAVRRLCEERLITAGGNRNSRHEDEIIREIGVAPADLQELVESRLLRREPRLQESFYELSHDSLVPSLQLAGGMRQTWVIGLKVAAIAVIVFSVARWGLPYVQSVYEMRSLASEFAAVKRGEAEVEYFRTRLVQARNAVAAEKLAEIQNQFDDWRKLRLQFTFLQAANLNRADSLLQVFKNEYPREEVLLIALSDTLRERQIRQVQQRYQRFWDRPVDLQEAYAKAGLLLDSAFTAFQANIRIAELQKDLAKRRGDIGEQQKLSRIIETQQDIASKALLGAIQIAEPKNMAVKGDSSGKASSFELVLEYNPLLANATVLLNGKEMSGEEIGSNKENVLQSSIRQKVVSARIDKFLTGSVPIRAGARQVSVQITVRNSNGVEASRDFIFTVDRDLPQVETFKILYKDNEEEAWKEMPRSEWRGNFWQIEVEPSEQLQSASAIILYATIAGKAVAGRSAVGESELVFTATLTGNWREVIIEGTNKDFSNQGEISCVLKMQDLVGWQSSISLGKWKVVKTQTAPVTPTSTGQPPANRLRSMPNENLTEDEVRNMIKKYDFYCVDNQLTKKWSNPEGKGFVHNFIPQQNGQVIIDRATGLMWQQSGSQNYMIFEQAQKYVEELNRQKFTGFNDWRLPTLEEAMSLVQPQLQGGFSLDPVFDRNQILIWTADKFSASSAWFVYFTSGRCGRIDVHRGLYVRGVR